MARPGNKQVLDRKTSTELVAAAAETHAARITDGFTAAFEAKLGKKEGKVPDLGLAVLLIARALRDVTGELVAKSDAYDAELADDSAPRDARDTAVAALVDTMVGVRAAVETLYGTPGLEALGIDGRTPTDPAGIASHASKAASRLRDPKVELPKAVRKGIKIDLAALAGELDAPLATLAQAQKDVVREVREAQAASDGKTKAMTANDDLFGRAANFISAALELVGEDELAARVRPVVRRPGTAAGVPGADGGGDAGAAPAGKGPGGGA